MLHITSLDTGLELFKALGSDIRIEIIKLLLKNKDMNLNELATNLNITNGALTSHIKKLEDCGIIQIINETTGHGNEKRCKVILEKIIIDIGLPIQPGDIYEATVGIGQYSDYQVEPSCGLATTGGFLGELDNIRYFSHPDRMHANILWFKNGFVEYLLPNFIPTAHIIDELTIQIEIASLVSSCDSSFASDLDFYLNQIKIGQITLAGDTGKGSGVYTPNWFDTSWKQFGTLKQISIKKEGTFIDGIKVSDTSIDSLGLDYSSILKFKIAVNKDSIHSHGVTLYGNSFGNYNQDIKIKIAHSKKEQ